MKKIQKKSGVQYAVLVPNKQGLENAIQVGCDRIAIFTTVSETFSKKNTHCSVAESLMRIQEVISLAKKNNIFIRGYISCVLGCPDEGWIPVKKTALLGKKLLDMGCDEIALGDTIGKATVNQAETLIDSVTQAIHIEQCAIHFHDTCGQALTNIYACLKWGISKIDASVGGLGGCPYAKGASGNVATEEVVYLLNGLGIETGINLDALMQASHFIHQYLPHPPRSKIV